MNKLLQKYAQSPAAFRNDLLVDVNGTVMQFGRVMDDWQRADFAALDPGLMRCNGHSDDDAAITRCYLERGRGHSKTTDLAVTCVWALSFATRPIKGYAFAADKDQAGLLKNAMDTLVRLNPWLATILDVQKNNVTNIAKGHPGCGSQLKISASDVASSYGLLADFLICDELTHWQGDSSLFDSIISTAAKRTNCFLCIISNAGFADSWQWQIREAARTSDGWHFSRLDGPVASWFTEARLEEQRKMLPAIAYARLWLNQWSSGGGDALTPEVINAAFHDELHPMSGNERNWLFVAGVDLGLVRDCAAVVVLAVPQGGLAGKIRLAHHKLWQPVPGKKVNLLDVQRYIMELDKQYGLEFCGFDPWQAEHMAQTLEAHTDHRRRNSRRVYKNQPWMREVPPTSTNLRQQATLTIEFFNDRRVHLYDCEPLKRDLHKLRVVEKSYGVRLESPHDGTGHGDTFSAFALALLMANEVAGKRPVVLRAAFGHGVDGNAESFEARAARYAAQEEEGVRSMYDRNEGFVEAMLTKIYGQ